MWRSVATKKLRARGLIAAESEDSASPAATWTVAQVCSIADARALRFATIVPSLSTDFCQV